MTYTSRSAAAAYISRYVMSCSSKCQTDGICSNTQDMLRFANRRSDVIDSYLKRAFDDLAGRTPQGTDEAPCNHRCRVDYAAICIRKFRLQETSANVQKHVRVSYWGASPHAFREGPHASNGMSICSIQSTLEIPCHWAQKSPDFPTTGLDRNPESWCANISYMFQTFFFPVVLRHGCFPSKARRIKVLSKSMARCITCPLEMPIHESIRIHSGMYSCVVPWPARIWKRMPWMALNGRAVWVSGAEWTCRVSERWMNMPTSVQNNTSSSIHTWMPWRLNKRWRMLGAGLHMLLLHQARKAAVWRWACELRRRLMTVGTPKVRLHVCVCVWTEVVKQAGLCSMLSETLALPPKP